MLMIRFQRIGRKNDPAFRMVVLEKASGPKTGKFVDLVGTYNPKTKAITMQADRIKEWLAKGAQLSPSLHNLMVAQGVIEGKKINVLPKKTAPVKEAPVEAAAPAAAAVAEEAAPAELPTEEEVAAEAEPAAEDAAPEEAPAAEAAPEAKEEEVAA